MKSLFKYIILFFAELPIQMKKTERAPEDTLSVFHLVAFLHRYFSNQAEKGRLLAPFWSITNCCSAKLHFHFALTAPDYVESRKARCGRERAKGDKI